MIWYSNNPMASVFKWCSIRFWTLPQSWLSDLLGPAQLDWLDNSMEETMGITQKKLSGILLGLPFDHSWDTEIGRNKIVTFTYFRTGRWEPVVWLCRLGSDWQNPQCGSLVRPLALNAWQTCINCQLIAGLWVWCPRRKTTQIWRRLCFDNLIFAVFFRLYIHSVKIGKLVPNFSTVTPGQRIINHILSQSILISSHSFKMFEAWKLFKPRLNLQGSPGSSASLQAEQIRSPHNPHPDIGGIVQPLPFSFSLSIFFGAPQFLLWLLESWP